MITLSNTDQIKLIQGILGVTQDGLWGPKSEAALDKITTAAPAVHGEVEHDTYASSFADPADVEAFEKCKAKGNSDSYCFQFGDNGIGCWGDSTVEGTGPSCALPPEYMEGRWGTVNAAKNKRVRVKRKSTGDLVECVLKDRMPSVVNLANKAKIDLNPDACAAIGLEPPCMEPVVWMWSEGGVNEEEA